MSRQDGCSGWVVVNDLDRLIAELSNSPAGALLVFLAVFLARVYLDKWDRQRSEQKSKKKGASDGA